MSTPAHIASETPAMTLMRVVLGAAMGREGLLHLAFGERALPADEMGLA